MTTTLECKHLNKTVNANFSLQEVDFKVESGECAALIGPNGAGKTTFFQLITGNSDPSSGDINLLGKKFRPEFHELKKQIGYLSQDINLPLWVTPNELLSYSSKLHGIENAKPLIEEQIEMWKIAPYLNKPIASCSHGMKKRAGLAVALLHSPKLLILDEPFAGLDILHINSLKALLKKRANDGLASILSTHILPYASELCNKAYTIRDGKVDHLAEWNQLSFDLQQNKIESHFSSTRN